LLGRSLNPSRFVALLEEFRQKITHERISSRISEIKQEELIALVKLEAEVKARYLVSVLELIDPKMTDLPHHVDEARHYRKMFEEIEHAVKNLVKGVVAKEIPMPGLVSETEFSAEVERAIEAYIQVNQEEWDHLE